MTNLIKWNLKQETDKVTFYSPDLSRGQEFLIYVFTPNRSRFEWKIIGHANGPTKEELYLDSGVGQYLFVPDPKNCQFYPLHLIINNCVCDNPSESRCNIQISGPSQLSKGATHKYRITGLLPATAVSIRVNSPVGPPAQYVKISDNDGYVEFELTRNIVGMSTLTVSDGQCISAPFQVEIKNSSNLPATLDTAFPACEGAIVITSQFSWGEYQPGDPGTAKISIKNEGMEARWLSMFTTLNFPIIAGMPPRDVYLAPGETVEYIMSFTVGTGPSPMEIDVTGVYSCNGQQYNPVGGKASARIGVGDVTTSCKASISNFQIVVEDSVHYLQFTVNNTGLVDINATQVTLSVLPEGVTIPDSYTPTSETISVGAMGTLKVPVSFESSGSYSFQLPEGTVQYGCAGVASQVIAQNLFLNYIVN